VLPEVRAEPAGEMCFKRVQMHCHIYLEYLWNAGPIAHRAPGPPSN